jgi:hypothetical protein
MRVRGLLAVCGVALLGAPVLGGCRPDPGPSLYDDMDFTAPDGGGGAGGEDLPGPTPYVAGQPRLAVGAFYEGGRSEEVQVNGTDSNLYIYEATASLDVVGERVEGKQAEKVVHSGKAWLGLGVHWSAPRDLTKWRVLHVSLRSADPGFSDVKVGMNSGASTSVQLGAAAYGWRNDGEWHHLAIPVADFVAKGLVVRETVAPFVLVAGQGASGHSLLLDNLYFTVD